MLDRFVGDVDRFATEHWGRSPMLRREAGDFTDLLDLDAVERLLAATARRPTFRLVRDGTPLDPARTTATVRLAGRTIEDAADVAKVAAEVAGGATLVLQALQRTWLPLADACRALERETSHPVQANAYLTPPGAAGLAEHADTHDVLVVQLEGAKAWTIAGLGEVELRAGDVAYLPTGTRHSAAAQSESSLHLTIGLLRITWRDVLLRALPALDAPLPLGFGRRDFAAELEQVLVDAASSLRSADVDALVAAEQDRARRRRRPLGLGALRSVLGADSIDADSVVVRPADVPTIVSVDGGEPKRVVVELLDRRVRLPFVALDAVERLASGDAVRIGDLPGIDLESRVVVARRLVREGMLRIVS